MTSDLARVNELVRGSQTEISRLFSISDIRVPETVNVAPVADRGACDQFPAVTKWNNGSMTLEYCHRAVQENADRYAEGDAGVFEAVERLYVMGGVALGVIRKRVGDADNEKIGMLYSRLSGVEGVNKDIDDDSYIPEEEKENLKLAVFESDEQRLLRINVGRFLVGLIGSGIASEDADLALLTERARIDLVEGLTARKKTKDLYLAFQFGEQDAELNTARNFVERVPELTLSLCYPMGFQAVKNTLDVITLQNQDTPESGTH